MTAIAEAERIDLIDDPKRRNQLANSLRHIVAQARAGGFAVSGETFYVEHKRMLFKWKPGETEWTHTGLIDLGKTARFRFAKCLQGSASGEIVYVGKREGNCFNRLMQVAVEGHHRKSAPPLYAFQRDTLCRVSGLCRNGCWGFVFTNG